MKKLPAELRHKAEGMLRVYGGIEGLAKNPAWLINAVLKTWFTDSERKLLLNYISEAPGSGVSFSREI
jgi:hypothetical protein